MAIKLNHTIVSARDKRASAAFLRIYFEDPSGHYLEVLTRPYGSGN